MSFRSCIFIFLIFFQGLHAASNEKIPFKIIHANFGKTKKFRILPANTEAWRRLKTYGFTVNRTQLPDAGETLISRQKLTPSPVRPYTKNQLDEYAVEFPAAALISELLYPEKREVRSTSDVVAIVKEQEQLFMSSMLVSLQYENLAIFSGLGFEDSLPQNKNTCLYEFIFPDQKKSDTIYVRISAGEYFTPPKPAVPVLQSHDERIGIVFQNLENEDWYYAVNIQRSTDSGKTWTQLNAAPLPISMEINGIKYNLCTDTWSGHTASQWYRINCQSYFGSCGPFSDRAIIEKKPANLHPPTDLKFIKSNTAPGKLYWNFPENELQQINGFKIYWQSAATDSLELCMSELLAPDVRTFQIEVDGYYRVKAMGKLKQEAESWPLLVQLPDTTPPEIPANLNANTAENGIINLRWSAVSEINISGYTLYRCNTRNGEYSVANSKYIRDTQYTDTIRINWMRDSIYYYLTASDNRQNESMHSQILAVKVNQFLTPENIVLKSTIIDARNIRLSWRFGAFKPAKLWLYKSYSKDMQPSAVVVLPTDDTAYTDTAVQPDMTCYYKLVPESETGIKNLTGPVRPVTTYLPQILPVFRFSSVLHDSAHKQVVFYWPEPQKNGISHFRILGKSHTGKWETLGIAQAESRFWQWKYGNMEAKKDYAIVVYFSDGRRTAF